MPQYQQNVTEQFGPEQLSTGWPWRLFVFSLIALSISLVTYVGIKYGYEPYLQTQIDAKDTEINTLAAKISKDSQDKLTRFYSQLLNLKSVLDNHTISSKIFPFMEKVTNKTVYFTKFSANVKERTLTLEGITDSFDTLAQQLEAFRQAPEVERFLINESQLTEGKVRFKATVFLMPSMFKP